MQMKKDLVFNNLRETIISGYFRPGENLSEREIADLLGVSRTPVREAFQKLEKEGLVVYTPKKGVTVPSFSTQQLKHIYDVREQMEGLAARLLADKEDKSFLEEMRKNIELAAKETDVKKQAIINGHFHYLIAENTQNPYLISIFQNLHSKISLIRSTSLSYQDRIKTNLKEHLQICDAIESGNPELAELVARTHIRNSMKSALAAVEVQSQIPTQVLKLDINLSADSK
jgi:DNA-binding GntR family transcriptional regulator